MSKEPKEGVIRIVPASESGVSDGVEMMAQTAMAIFERKDGKVVGIGNIGNLPCKMMASYETGTFSVSVRGSDPFMVSVRLDELMALLHAAAARHVETAPKAKKKNAPKGEKEGEKHE